MDPFGSLNQLELWHTFTLFTLWEGCWCKTKMDRQSLKMAGICIFLAFATTAAAVKPETWLIPISRNGPNNQKRDFRNVLAMAKKFDTGYVLTGLYKHYRENVPRFKMNVTVAQQPDKTCFPDNTPVWGYMDFGRVLDRKPVDEWITTATVSELKQQEDWDGHLDAVVYPDAKDVWEDNFGYIKRTLTAEGLTLDPKATHILTPALLRCNPEIMGSVKAAIHKFKYVGVLLTSIAHHVVPNLVHEPVQTPTASCYRSVYEANRVVQTAPWVRAIAKKYIRQTLINEKFMAVQVRPYPDYCSDEWRRVGTMQTVKPADINSKECIREHKDLHLKLGRCVLDMMRGRGLTRVFVMAHPAIQPTIAAIIEQAHADEVKEFSGAGVKIVDRSLVPASRPPLLEDDFDSGNKAAQFNGFNYLRLEDIGDLAGCADTSPTFLSMIEESIAVEADMFVGSSASSITHSIAYQRMGLGRKENFYLEKLEC